MNIQKKALAECAKLQRAWHDLGSLVAPYLIICVFVPTQICIFAPTPARTHARTHACMHVFPERLSDAWFHM